ncbi:MAG: Hpt domain-containing protein [Cardiobacteriaceae bacterium]|nr:Hpt domain-containing protein [Cardiobacteriaceae bacterium]
MATQNPQVRESSTGRYIGIIAPLILIVIIIAATVGVIYKNTQESRKVIAVRDLANEQAASIQNLKNIVYNLDLYARDLTDLDEGSIEQEDALEEIELESRNLQSVQSSLSASLKLLSEGGTAEINGKTVSIEKVDDERVFRDVEGAQATWSEYSRLLTSLNNEIAPENITAETTAFVTDYARTFNEHLVLSLSDINGYLQERIDKNDKLTENVELIAIAAIVLLFLYIILVSVSSLIRTDKQLGQARQEMREIMNSVQEGLFLISSDLKVGHETSRALRRILPVKQISDKLFDEVIEPLVNATDLTNTRRFIKQLFNKNVKQDLVDDLNPLRRLSIAIENESGLFEERFLSFHFTRVMENKQISHILASVRDITESVILQQQLEEERNQNAAYTEMLMKVLMIDQNLLASFISNAQKIAARINDTLRKQASTQPELRDKVDTIFREVHSFKGESSALGFENFVKIAEEAENKLKVLRQKTLLAGDDFLGVAISLDAIVSANRQLQLIQSRLQDFSTNRKETSADSASIGQLIVTQLENFASQVAERNGKQVQLVATGWENNGLNKDTLNVLKEISIQLLRNSVVHGIEKPDVRTKQEKPEVGQITVALSQTGDQYELRFEDDGAGIDLDALRAKLKASGQYEGVDVEGLSKQELYRSIFMSGLSTAKQESEDAGRGEGMGIVKDRIRDLPGGKIAIASLPSKFTRFVVRFNR